MTIPRPRAHLKWIFRLLKTIIWYTQFTVQIDSKTNQQTLDQSSATFSKFSECSSASAGQRSRSSEVRRSINGWHKSWTVSWEHEKKWTREDHNRTHKRDVRLDQRDSQRKRGKAEQTAFSKDRILWQLKDLPPSPVNRPPNERLLWLALGPDHTTLYGFSRDSIGRRMAWQLISNTSTTVPGSASGGRVRVRVWGVAGSFMRAAEGLVVGGGGAVAIDRSPSTNNSTRNSCIWGAAAAQRTAAEFQPNTNYAENFSSAVAKETHN